MTEDKTTYVVHGRLVDEDGVIIEPEGTAFTEPQLFTFMDQYLVARSARDMAAKDMERMAAPVRDRLEQRPGEELVDGERRIRAWLMERNTIELDAMSLARAKPELLVWLAEHGALKLDVDAWRALQNKAIEVEDIKGFVGPRGLGTALKIERER